jgi:hypothetical protein
MIIETLENQPDESFSRAWYERFYWHK